MLHVPVSGDAHFTWRVDYGDTIRKHALGRFDQLLAATTTHPAMLIFLSAATSTKRAPNENLGRELLELHTLGAGNYDEDDVKASARILTGYHVDLWEIVEGVLRQGGPRDRQGAGQGLHPQEPQGRRPRGHQGVPPLPRAPPD